ncbi:amino acid transporter heavy chain SLC3A1-like [Tubulanus polymorphus]|uniref:amino acid transporter heavy chain SLC3A1-like n=1 Tax=Tubulanus polymorphus TaxID=672921 RepID=UPI003DA6A302
MANEYKQQDVDPQTPSVKDASDTAEIDIDIVNDNEPVAVDLKPDKPYAGMGKEDLLRFSQTPFWCRFRAVLLVIFFLTWLVLIAASVAFIVVFPRCKPTPTATWWQTKPIYNIFTRSFYDSDGDGNGDLKGIEMKVNYLKSLGIGTVKLYPIFTDSNESIATNLTRFGFRTSNFTDIDPMYGNLADFESLVTALHKNNMKLVLDWVINHTSDKHRWFKESRKSNSPTNPYRNYYVWAPCDNSTHKPNNWLSVRGGSAWTYDSQRKECYLHQFSAEEPDLNFRSMMVREEMDKIARFWLDRGVDGFNLVRLQFLVEDYDLRDSKPSGKTNVTDSYDYLDHEYTFVLPGCKAIINRLLHIMQNYSTDSDSDDKRAVFVDALEPSEDARRLYGDDIYKGADIVFQPRSHVMLLMPVVNATSLAESLNGSMSREPSENWPGEWPATLLYHRSGFDDIARGVPVMKDRVADTLKAMTFLLPATPVVLYGNEIGQLQASSGAYPAVRPMQWDNTTNAGFSGNDTTASAPWISLAPKWDTLNVQIQNVNKISPLSQFRQLSALRGKEASIQAGLMTVGYTTHQILSFVRHADGHPGFLLVCNFGSTADMFKPQQMAKSELIHSENMEVEFVTGGDFPFKKGDTVQSGKQFVMPPESAAIFRWEYEIKNHL